MVSSDTCLVRLAAYLAMFNTYVCAFVIKGSI